MFHAYFPSGSHTMRTRRRLAGLALVCTAFASLGAQAQQVLTFDRALLAAQERSRQLAAQDAAAAASRHMAIAAGQRPDPTLKVGLNNLPINGQDRFSLTADFMTMRSVGLMQELTRADKLKARSARFDREAELAEAGRAWALSTLRRETAQAWLERHFQEQMVEVLRSQRAESSLQIEAAESAYRGARGAQADVFAARSAVALIDDRIRQTERQLATAKAKLSRWVGDEASQPLGAVPSLAAIRLASADLETQLARHPEMAMLAKQEDVALAEADIARSSKRSDWSVELMYNQRGPAYSHMVSVNLSIPLQLAQNDRQDRELAAKLAVADQLRAQREEAMRERLSDARNWLQEWASDRARLGHYDSTVIPLAAERTRAALAAYRGGAGPLGAVLEARRMEIESRLDRLRLEMEAAARWAQLEYMIPPTLDGSWQERPAASIDRKGE